MTYKERLIQFNSTEKYQRELEFLVGLLDKSYCELLDYGCGVGTAMKYISDHTKCVVKGWDKENYGVINHWFLDAPPVAKYGHITFIHSLAHIMRPEFLLTGLQENLHEGGKITVITPNADWISQVGDTHSDPTVVCHFTPRSLRLLFESCNYKVIQEGQFGSVKNGRNERLFIQCSI